MELSKNRGESSITQSPKPTDRVETKLTHSYVVKCSPGNRFSHHLEGGSSNVTSSKSVTKTKNTNQFI